MNLLMSFTLLLSSPSAIAKSSCYFKSNSLISNSVEVFVGNKSIFKGSLNEGIARMKSQREIGNCWIDWTLSVNEYAAAAQTAAALLGVATNDLQEQLNICNMQKASKCRSEDQGNLPSNSVEK